MIYAIVDLELMEVVRKRPASEGFAVYESGCEAEIALEAAFNGAENLWLSNNIKDYLQVCELGLIEK